MPLDDTGKYSHATVTGTAKSSTLSDNRRYDGACSTVAGGNTVANEHCHNSGLLRLATDIPAKFTFRMAWFPESQMTRDLIVQNDAWDQRPHQSV